MPRVLADTLSDWGEDRLVAHLIGQLATEENVQVGPGDDCAVIGKPGDKQWQLLKTDAVVEGIHFRPDENWRRVGWKALCRTISDIAAMGGTPEHALVTIAVAPSETVERLDALY